METACPGCGDVFIWRAAIFTRVAGLGKSLVTFFGLWFLRCFRRLGVGFFINGFFAISKIARIIRFKKTICRDFWNVGCYLFSGSRRLPNYETKIYDRRTTGLEQTLL